MRHRLTPVLFWLLLFGTAAAPAQVKVAALHPLLADLAAQVGGSRVKVVELVKPGGDVHHFEPSPADLADLRGVKVILASGLHLENYLDSLRDSVPGVPVLEVGGFMPVLKILHGQEKLYDEDVDVRSGIDPHWWHSIDNLKRAARVIGDALSEVDPGGGETFKDGVTAAQKRLSLLKAWAHVQFSVIPRAERRLVTAHAAFGYFCREFGFQPMPLLGLSREDEAAPAAVAMTVRAIRENNIRAVFPEDQSNPKVVQEIVRETAVRLGVPLVADGTSQQAHTCEAVFRHNVESIVNALRP